MRERLAGLLGAGVVAAPFVVGAAMATYADDGGQDGVRELWRFADPDIVESSGLVVTDDRVLTVNDSGDDARVFVVDRATGETVGTTRWDGDAEDVEALAPVGAGDAGEVWVGDIGDNLARRDEVTVTRIPVADGERTVPASEVRLTYRDGPRDAEALLVHPRTGQLVVVTKGVLAGEVLVAADELDPERPNPLRVVGRAPGVVTDGAFWPDGRHLVLRTYSRAVVLAWPSLEEVGSWTLPEQPQGEGLAVGPDEALYVSSEGIEQPLLRVEVPADIRERMRPDGPQPRGGQSLDEQADPAEPLPAPDADDLARDIADRDAWPWWTGGLVAVALVVLSVRAVRRPR